MAQSLNFIDTVVKKKSPCSLVHMGSHKTYVPDFDGDGRGHCLKKIILREILICSSFHGAAPCPPNLNEEKYDCVGAASQSRRYQVAR